MEVPVPGLILSSVFSSEALALGVLDPPGATSAGVRIDTVNLKSLFREQDTWALGHCVVRWWGPGCPAMAPRPGCRQALESGSFHPSRAWNPPAVGHCGPLRDSSRTLSGRPGAWLTLRSVEFAVDW